MQRASGVRILVPFRSVPFRSVPRSVLASDPDSLLYKGSGTTRATSPRDGLPFGAAPAERNPLVLEQARHWYLKPSVGALEALNAGVIVTNDS